MKKNVFLLLFFVPYLLYGQSYINKIVPFSFGNPNFKNIQYLNGSYLIPVIYPSDSSTLLLIDPDFEPRDYFHYVDFVFSLSAMTVIDNDLYLYAKDRNLQKGLQAARLNTDFSYNWKVDIPTIGGYNFPLSSVLSGHNIIGTYIYEEGSRRRFGIFDIKPGGAVVWNNVYDNNLKYATLWDLCRTKSSHILGSYNATYSGDFYSSVRVLKIDTSGAEIWKSDTLSGVFDNDSPVWLTELSDSTIFLTYQKDMFDDPEYLWNWNTYPPTYIWLDREGKKIREDILKVNKDYDVYISEVKAGRGDYFYTFGQITSYAGPQTNLYGFITKYANNGDTIWTHTYRHVDYDLPDILYNIHDIIEEENGDIVALGAITPVGEKTEVWVFRVNSEGCFGTDSCEEFTLSGRPVTGSTGEQITVSPNPTTGRISIQGLPEHAAVTILLRDMAGRPVLQYAGPVSAIPDISRHPAGMYVLQLGSGGYYRAFKIIKI